MKNELTPDMLKYLRDNYGYYRNCIDGGACRLSPDMVAELDAIHRHFEPNVKVNWWCNACVGDALRFVFGQYESQSGINK